MNMMPAFLALLLWGANPEMQTVPDSSGQETREVRIFLLDRTTPERAVKDAAAVLTLERKSGRGETFLFPRATKEAPAMGAEPGMIRSLVSTPYFVEFSLEDPAPAPGREETKKPDAADGATEPKQPLSSDEVLRRARKGTWFSRRMPVSAFSEPFTATVTIRLGNLTFTSEEFQGPRSAHDTPKEAAARVDRSLETLRERIKDSAGFMDLKPVVGELTRELSKVAPAGFEDGTGAIERDRQWCLAMARAMGDACDQGNTERIRELSLQCGPRMKQMQETLAQMKGKEPEPPEAPPTVK